MLIWSKDSLPVTNSSTFIVLDIYSDSSFGTLSTLFLHLCPCVSCHRMEWTVMSSSPEAATPTTTLTAQPLWATSRAALMPFTLPIHAKDKACRCSKFFSLCEFVFVDVDANDSEHASHLTAHDHCQFHSFQDKDGRGGARLHLASVHRSTVTG